MPTVPTSPTGDQHREHEHLRRNDHAQAAFSDVMRGKRSCRVATSAARSVATSLTASPFEGLAVLADENFDVSLRGCGADSKIILLMRGASRYPNGGLLLFFVRSQVPWERGRGSRIMRAGGVEAGSGRGLGAK